MPRLAGAAYFRKDLGEKWKRRLANIKEMTAQPRPGCPWITTLAAIGAKICSKSASIAITMSAY